MIIRIIAPISDIDIWNAYWEDTVSSTKLGTLHKPAFVCYFSEKFFRCYDLLKGWEREVTKYLLFIYFN